MNVANSDREDFGAFLLHNCSRVAFFFCFFVFNTSCFAFLNLGGDFAIADLHRHALRGTTNRQWESKHCFGRRIKRVLKSCFDGPCDAVAVNSAVDVNCGDREFCVTGSEADA